MIAGKFDAGKFRHVITLQRDEGDPGQTDWQTVGEYRCFVSPTTGKETYFSKEVNPLEMTTVVMRNVGVITSEDRFIYKGKVLNIDYVREESTEFGMFYTVFCVSTGKEPE